MIPLTIEAKATVKLAGRESDGMDEAIERFLGKGPDAAGCSGKDLLHCIEIRSEGESGRLFQLCWGFHVGVLIFRRGKNAALHIGALQVGL